MKIELNFDETKDFLDTGIGLALILKYEPEAEVATEHNEIWVGSYQKTFSKMTDKEKEIMEKSYWSENEDSWHSFT